MAASKILGKGRSIKPNTGLKGMDIVLRNLNKEIRDIKDRSLVGLIEAVVMLRADMEPKIPVDLANLKASFFTVTSKSQSATPAFNNADGGAAELSTDYASAIADAKARIGNHRMPLIIFGFSANYSAAVHEMPEYYNFSKEGTGPKWMESVIKADKDQILEIIHKNAKIRK